MRSLKYPLLDAIRGIPAISALSVALALRRPMAINRLLADTWRSFRKHAGLRLPGITPWELLEFKDIVTLRLGENGLFAAMEPNFLVMQIAAMLRPQRIFEIGTSRGRTTGLLAMNTPETTRIFTLDLPPDEPAPGLATDLHLIELAKSELGSTFRNTPWQARITQLLGNSATFDYSPYHDSMDLVLVDGSHSYPFVLRDTLNAFRMIRPGGVILWHDYESMRTEHGVTRVVNGLRKRHGLPTFRLSRPESDTRYAVLRVDEAGKRKGISLAAAHWG